MDKELVKDRECIHCMKMFSCKGKPRGIKCVCMEKRDEDGRETNVYKKNNRE